MVCGKDEVLFSKVFNRETGVEQLLVAFPEDISEETALDMFAEKVDMSVYKKTGETQNKGWLDAILKTPRHRFVIYERSANSNP